MKKWKFKEREKVIKDYLKDNFEEKYFLYVWIFILLTFIFLLWLILSFLIWLIS